MTPTLTPAIQLANRLRQCQSWAEVEQAIATHQDQKAEAWHLLTAEQQSRLKELKRASEPPALEVGSKVIWHDCPGCEDRFNPFTVRAVEGDFVWLDWIRHAVNRSRLSEHLEP